MRLLPVLSLIGFLAVSPLFGAPQKNEYFTDTEIDLIRDAQEIKVRVPVLFTLADRRLFFLGVKEKTDKQREEDRKAREKLQKDAEKAAKAGGPKVTTPIDPEAYLADFTKSELFRGYIEALDEVMSNIDDAYERKFDVRESLEGLEKYTNDTLPLLEKYTPKSNAEEGALLDARDKTKEARDAAREAMTTVPKTEKKSTK
jgi:hypothetical protein